MLQIQASYSFMIPNSETRQPGAERKAHREPRPRIVQQNPEDPEERQDILSHPAIPRPTKLRTKTLSVPSEAPWTLEQKARLVLPVTFSGQAAGRREVPTMELGLKEDPESSLGLAPLSQRHVHAHTR